MPRRVILLVTFALVALCLQAQSEMQAGKRLFTDAFQPAEFAARRAKVMAAVGQGVATRLCAAPEVSGTGWAWRRTTSLAVPSTASTSPAWS